MEQISTGIVFKKKTAQPRKRETKKIKLYRKQSTDVHKYRHPSSARCPKKKIYFKNNRKNGLLSNQKGMDIAGAVIKTSRNTILKKIGNILVLKEGKARLKGIKIFLLIEDILHK